MSSETSDPKPWAYSKDSREDSYTFGTPDRAETRIDAAMGWFPRVEVDSPDGRL